MCKGLNFNSNNYPVTQLNLDNCVQEIICHVFGDIRLQMLEKILKTLTTTTVVNEIIFLSEISLILESIWYEIKFWKSTGRYKSFRPTYEYLFHLKYLHNHATYGKFRDASQENTETGNTHIIYFNNNNINKRIKLGCYMAINARSHHIKTKQQTKIFFNQEAKKEKQQDINIRIATMNSRDNHFHFLKL